MGIPLSTPPTMTPPAGDAANAVVTGTIASTGTTLPFSVYGPFNIAVWGTFTGSAALEKTYNGGTTWIPTIINAGTVALALTTPASVTANEVERGVSYHLNCTVNSGTISYRFSTTGLMAQSIGP